MVSVPWIYTRFYVEQSSAVSPTADGDGGGGAGAVGSMPYNLRRFSWRVRAVPLQWHGVPSSVL